MAHVRDMEAFITVKDTPSPAHLVFATAEGLRKSEDMDASGFHMLKKIAIARGYEAQPSVLTGKCLNPSRYVRSLPGSRVLSMQPSRFPVSLILHIGTL